MHDDLLLNDNTNFLGWGTENAKLESMSKGWVKEDDDDDDDK